MKIIYTLLLLAALSACKEPAAKPTSAVESNQNKEIAEKLPYPENLVKVFDAHGGLDKWKSMRSLVYEIPKKDYSEVHTINLYSRKDRVDTPDYSMGFDGRDVWLQDGKGQYEGDPVFYHNLMFYFYAMPFVLADSGIIYTETEDLYFEGKNYPGIGIGYQSDIGTSPKDQYFIHFDPDTYQMTWLGYTVTYRSGEISDNVKWIRYDSWQEVSGLNLPSAITWHEYEGRTIKEARSTVSFERVVLSDEANPNDFFNKPDDAKTVLPKVYD